MPPPPIVKVEKMEVTEAPKDLTISAAENNKDEAIGSDISAIKTEENGTSAENDPLGLNFGIHKSKTYII